VANVEILGKDHRPAREDRVSVTAAVYPPVLSEGIAKTQLICYETRLIIFSLPCFLAQDFLKSHHVRIEVSKNLHDTPGKDPAVKTATFVDIVGDDAKCIETA
jgi:hypothetical protein